MPDKGNLKIDIKILDAFRKKCDASGLKYYAQAGRILQEWIEKE